MQHAKYELLKKQLQMQGSLLLSVIHFKEKK